MKLGSQLACEGKNFFGGFFFFSFLFLFFVHMHVGKKDSGVVLRGHARKLRIRAGEQRDVLRTDFSCTVADRQSSYH